LTIILVVCPLLIVGGNANSSKQVHAAYWGWAKYCNSINLMKKLSA
jgi:hypothetical protein